MRSVGAVAGLRATDPCRLTHVSTVTATRMNNAP